ncbi:MAG: hypothetical protein IJR59_07480 [Firmicutes bacterium]|nr:hypothetical protein [Bacillota bacterium]
MFPKIKIKPSFWIVAAFCVKAGISKYFLTVFLLVILHECCHIFTAMLWDIKTSRIVITPIGAYAQMCGLEQLHITKRIMTALAGPLFNLALCPFCNGILRQTNLVIALFNLIPLYPLDGGKIFHYIISYFIGVLRGNLISVKLSVVISILLVSAGLAQLILYPPNLSLLCLGIYFYRFNKANTVNLTYSFYKTIINKNDNKVMPVRNIAASAKIDIKAILYRLGWDYYTVVHIRQNNDVFLLNEEVLLNYVMTKGIKGKLGEIDTP